MPDYPPGTPTGTAGTPTPAVQSVQGVAGGTAVPVSSAALPLPTGAATEAGHLATIDGKVPALGQALAAASVPVVLASDQAGVAVKPQSLELAGLSSTGTGTPIITSQDCTGYKTLSLQLFGTFVGTVTFQQSNDGTNWLPYEFLIVNSIGTSALVGSASGAGGWTGPVLMRYFRATVTAYTSGTIQGVAELSAIPYPVTVVLAGALQQGAWTVTQSGVFTAVPVAATTGGSTPYHLLAAATTNAQSIKATAGQVYGIAVSNAAAYAVYVKLFNKASAPTVGTDTPIITVLCPGATSIQRRYHVGAVFGSGIAIAMTKALTDLDTTALVAGDCIADVDYK